MTKYTRQHYQDIGKLLGKGHAPKKDVDSWCKRFKKDNPRFKPTMFRAWVKKYR